MYNNIGRALRNIRVSCRLTQEELANRIQGRWPDGLIGSGLQTEISRWENGYNEPSLNRIYQIVTVCGKDIAEFFETYVVFEDSDDYLTD